jgi:DNA repair photolyase
MPGEITVKSILNKTKRRDPWFLDDYTLNPYSGCSFNCLFCYIRGSKYGTNMEEKLSVKSNALELLEKQLSLRSKKGQYGIIVLSSATDPYLQFEKETLLTRQILELILKYKFPVHVLTRSDLVPRDFDLLEQIDKTAILPAELRGKVSRGAFITFSFSTLDPVIGKIFEPGATDVLKRLDTLKTSLTAGFRSGVSLMPLLPFISDTSVSLEHLFKTFSEAGANYIFPATITLFGNTTADSKPLVMRAVKKHFPELEEKYHRFFDNSDYMPEYYQRAFSLKAKELSVKYGLKNTMLD